MMELLIPLEEITSVIKTTDSTQNEVSLPTPISNLPKINRFLVVVVSLPTPIPNLPKINLISCGSRFTVCVDCEGFIWSFGENNFAQLGTGNKRNFNVPQKLLLLRIHVKIGMQICLVIIEIGKK